MNKKIIILFLALVILASGFWFAYTLEKYDTFFLPSTVLRLNDPAAYYQQKISPLLIDHGREVKTENLDIYQWKKYEDKNLNFSFSYPDDFFIVKNNNLSMGISICYKENDKLCPIGVQLYDNLKKIVRGIESRVKRKIRKNKSLLYLKLNNNKIFEVIKFEEELSHSSVSRDFYFSVIGNSSSAYIVKFDYFYYQDNKLGNSSVINNIIKTMDLK